jgi:hypothetical protein
LVVENVVEKIEFAFGDAVLAVVGLALDGGIEGVDEPGLGRASLLADGFALFVAVAWQPLATGLDDGLEARFPAIGTGVMLSHLIPSDVKTQEVEAGLTVVGLEGVCE